MDDDELFNGDDFSSDDIFEDVTYTPPKKTSKRKVFEDGPPVKKACIDAANLNKTIFQPNFYVDFEKVCIVLIYLCIYGSVKGVSVSSSLICVICS